MLGLLLGLALGSAVYFALRSRFGPLRLAGRGYVSLVRGTPVLLLLMFLFYVVFARTRVDAIVVAVLAFGLNTAAYIAKIIESAVQAVEPGQVMAARTMGGDHAAVDLGGGLHHHHRPDPGDQQHRGAVGKAVSGAGGRHCAVSGPRLSHRAALPRDRAQTEVA